MYALFIYCKTVRFNEIQIRPYACSTVMSASKKPHMNLVVIGHVDNGKSTIVGHLMVDMGVIDQRTIDTYAKESEATGNVILSSMHGF